MVQHLGCQIKLKMDYTICFVDAIGKNPVTPKMYKHLYQKWDKAHQLDLTCSRYQVGS